MMKLAAIDIGSNAVRLLISHVYENGDSSPLIKKASLYRVPVRLGEDAFTRGHISEKKAQHLVKTMVAFRNLLDVIEPAACMACATSAMREADNGQEVMERVLNESGIQIHIIDGGMEADMICSNAIAEKLNHSKSYLYIDIGGGSTELSFFSGGKRLESRSFDIGTIRILEGLVSSERWKEMGSWIKSTTKGHSPILGIGSGGNINKIAKIAEKDSTSPLSLARMQKVHQHIQSHTYEERMRKLGLRPDRADVIVPAGEIILFVMEAARMSKLLVPKIGLSDGIIHHLYQQQKPS
ncbi:exopolyphosphatase [Desulfurispirillum indicum]|uniref:Ppx/GppA phosphatase family protein n=1 Tax=Desulfurispirillum indicum TaxID=936456 RepID=UPI001CF9CF9C|nr:exopolyphosphatase [Desulfurispirillum indicum]UCZ55860.1 exopolyphosphatase [Desulfurispirillum indicum]